MLRDRRGLLRGEPEPLDRRLGQLADVEREDPERRQAAVLERVLGVAGLVEVPLA